MPTVAERVSVVEVQVKHIDSKIDDLKFDVKDMHDCLDNTRDSVMAQLGVMTAEYRENSSKFFEHADKLHAEDAQAHAKLAAKVEELEKFKMKWMYLALGGFAVFGWISGHMDIVTKVFS